MNLPFLAILNFRFRNINDHLVWIARSSSPTEDVSAGSLCLLENHFKVIRRVYFSHFLSDFPRAVFFSIQLKEPAIIINLAKLIAILQHIIKAISVNNCDFVFYILKNKK
jgi:hypothetical protein